MNQENKGNAYALQNFGNAILRLEEFMNEPIQNDRDKAGIIQAFEFSFELGWKCIQKFAADYGRVIGSPRQAFQVAHELGWIDAETLVNSVGEPSDAWMSMSNDRNLSSHTYRGEIAEKVLGNIFAEHMARLKKLYSVLKSVYELDA